MHSFMFRLFPGLGCVTMEREIHNVLKQSLHSDASDGLKELQDFRDRYPNISIDVLKYDSSGDTILHCASRGHLEMVSYLLPHFSPNCRNKDNKTPLHEACQFGQIEIAKALLQAGADVNALKKADWTPLMLACTKITSKEEAHRRRILIDLLIAREADVNFRNKDGWSSLHLSVREGNTDILHTLISSGLNIKLRTNNGNTALHIAALHGHIPIFKLLAFLDNDSVHSINNLGNLPMHEAVLSKQLEMFKFAINYYGSEDFVVMNKSGFNVVHLSAFIGSLDILVHCIEVLQLDLHVTTLHKQNCLHLAARNAFWDVYKYCLNKGLDGNAKDKYGRLPSDYNKFIAG